LDQRSPRGGRTWAFLVVSPVPLVAVEAVSSPTNQTRLWDPTKDGGLLMAPCSRPAPVRRYLGKVHLTAMPVALHIEDWAAWLDAAAEDALSLAVPFPSQLMRVE
jgi:hypothetical protein